MEISGPRFKRFDSNSRTGNGVGFSLVLAAIVELRTLMRNR